MFDRYLTVGVLLCSVAGVALDQYLPNVFQAIGRIEVAQVNLPVGLLTWVMAIPMLIKVDFGAWGAVRKHVKGMGATLFVNWLVKPFSMALLGWLFIRHWLAPYLPAEQRDSIMAVAFAPLVIALLDVPILLPVFFSAALAYGLYRAVGEHHCVACR